MQVGNCAIFSLATKTSWKAKDSEEWQHNTEWHVIAWDKLSEAIRPLVKGDHLLIDGELRSSSYDKELPVVGGGTTIVPMKNWEIRARAIRKLARKKTNNKPVKADA